MKLDEKKFRTYAIVTNAVLTKAVLLVGAFYVGGALDRRFKTAPMFMMSGIVIALVVGFWWILYVTKKYRMR